MSLAKSAIGPVKVWAKLVSTPTLQTFQDESERLYLVAKLAEYGGNVTRTAEAIDTPRSNLYKKIERYGLRRDEKGRRHILTALNGDLQAPAKDEVRLRLPVRRAVDVEISLELPVHRESDESVLPLALSPGEGVVIELRE